VWAQKDATELLRLIEAPPGARIDMIEARRCHFEVEDFVGEHNRYILTKRSAHCQRVAADGDDCPANTFGRLDRSSSGESGAGRDSKREKAIRVGCLAIEDCHAATSGPLTLQGELRSIKLRKKRGRDPMNLLPVADWHGPPQGRFVAGVITNLTAAYLATAMAG
jgi:hypothetical protein